MKLLRLLSALLLTSVAVGQSVPNGGISQGQVWTVGQWNSAWASKADTASPVMTGTPSVAGVPLVFYPQISGEVGTTKLIYPPGNVLRYGADPTGSTDSTTALQNAVNSANSSNTSKAVSVPAGTYTFSALSFAGMTNVSLTCADRNSTILQFTGTGTAITISGGGGITLRNCGISATVTQSAGALISIVDDYYVRIEDNALISNKAFNQISVTCSANTPNQVYISGNQLFNAVNDDIYMSCTNASFAVSDIYIEPGQGQRNYISGAGRAGIELNGYLNGIFILENTIFGNNTGIIGSDSGFGGAALSSNTISHNDIDTNTVLGANFTGLKSTNLQGNHVFTGGITCTGCVNVAATGNHYEGASTLTLAGTTTWSDSGSHWSGMALPVSIGPNGSTPSSDITINDAQFVFGNGPFLTFTGGANPAARVTGSVELGTNATGCTSGTNVVGTSFMFVCGPGNSAVYPQTAAESAASVTPANYTVAPCNINRYATNTTPGTTDMSTAMGNALLSCTGVYVPAGTYVVQATVPNTSGLVIHGDGPASVLVQKSGGPVLAWSTAAVVYPTVLQTVRELAFDGTSGANPTIATAGAGGLTLKDLYFKQIPTGQPSIFVNGAAATIAHDFRLQNIQIYVTQAGSSGIEIGPLVNDSNLSQIIMNGNAAVANCIQFDSGASAITIVDSHPYNCTTHILNLVGSNNFNQFTHDAFDNTLGTGDLVLITGGSYNQFTDDYFENVSGGKNGVTLTNSVGNGFVNDLWFGNAGSGYIVSETGTSSFNYIANSTVNSNAVWTGAVANLIAATSSLCGMPGVASINCAGSFRSVTVNGAPVTVSGCGVAGSITGGSTAGSFTVGTGASPCTFVITMGGLTTAHGWVCNADDVTSAVHLPNAAAASTTACSVKGNAATNDVIQFSAMGY